MEGYMDNLFNSNEAVTAILNSNEVAVLLANNAEVAKKEKEIAMKEAATASTSTVTATDTTATDTTAVTEEVTEVNTDQAVTDEAATEEAVTGETVTDTAAVDETAATEVTTVTNVEAETVAMEKPVSGDVVIDPGYVEGGDMGEGMIVDPNMGQVKDPLLSSWPFVIGISAAVLFVSVVLGVLLARRKIKKGIELYED
jgi:hypothetical protein